MQLPFPTIFIHGLESSSQGYKAQLLRRSFPGILTPDFAGPIETRMAQLAPLLETEKHWVIIGSSFGGLMGTLWACAHPQRVQKLLLLAPALVPPYWTSAPPAPLAAPTVIYHGLRDTVVPLEPVRALAGRLFSNLTFHSVDDDHQLRQTVDALDWATLLGIAGQGME